MNGKIARPYLHVPAGNPSLSLGPGRIALHPGWRSAKRQVICWYVQIGERPDLELTAQTLITHSNPGGNAPGRELREPPR